MNATPYEFTITAVIDCPACGLHHHWGLRVRREEIVYQVEQLRMHTLVWIAEHRKTCPARAGEGEEAHG